MEEQKKLTPEEIEARKQAGAEKAREQYRQRAFLEEQRKADTKFLQENGFQILYMENDGLSFAFKRDKKGGTGEAFFAVKSRKDHWSTPVARRTLVRHIEQHTHNFYFQCDFLNFQPNETNELELEYVLLRRTLRQAELHPEWFPRDFLWDYKRAYLGD